MGHKSIAGQASQAMGGLESLEEKDSVLNAQWNLPHKKESARDTIYTSGSPYLGHHVFLDFRMHRKCLRGLYLNCAIPYRPGENFTSRTTSGSHIMRNLFMARASGRRRSASTAYFTGWAIPRRRGLASFGRLNIGRTTLEASIDLQGQAHQRSGG